MAKLTFKEKQVFERIFNRDGYVLDFSNRTFAEFFADFDVEILSEKYNKNSGSKMNRLRAFWGLERDELIGKVLQSLLELANDMGQVEQKDNEFAREYINQLLSKKDGGQLSNKELSQNEFLKEKFKRIDLSLLNLETYTNVISQRIEEINKCLSVGAFFSVILLCGSSLEGILLNLATQNLKKFNSSRSAPKDKEGKVLKFNNWSLNDFINVAYEQDFIGLDIKKYSHSLRDFRNFIHPYQQVIMGFNPDTYTARISWQILQATIADLSGTRK